MKVSELARRVGIAPSALRFYEAEGILPAPPRGRSGYREYAEEDLCRTRVMVSLKALGLDIREAARLAELCSSGHCDLMADDLLPQLAARRLEIASARAELDHLDARLALLEATIRDGGTDLGLEMEGADCATCDQACCSPT